MKRRASPQNAFDVLSQRKRAYTHRTEDGPWQALGADRSIWNRLDRVAILSEDATESHSGCVNALHWSSDGRMLLSGGDDTRVHIWKLSTSSDMAFGLKCTAQIYTGHTNNIFNVQLLGNSNRVVTCAADRQVRVFDINQGLSSNDSDMVKFRERDSCIRVFKCHRKKVKRIITENSQDCFLTVAEDGTVRQHDLRVHHKCSPAGASCSAVLVRVPFELSTISMSGLTSYQFVVAGESPFAFLFDRRQVGRRIKEEWGVDLTASEITTCVRRFGQPPYGVASEKSGYEYITGSRMSQSNGHELLLSYSDDAIYSFSTRDTPEETLPSSTPITDGKENGKGGRTHIDAEEMPEELQNTTSKRGYDKDLPSFLSQPVVYPRQKYLGACNVRTIKDVNFIGPRDEYVVSGSDDGNLFIWDKKTGDIVDIHEGDGSIVNVIEQHPYLPILAVSGIDETVKIFSPQSDGVSKSSRLLIKDEIVKNNTSRVFPGRRLQLGDLLLHFEAASVRRASELPEGIQCVHQ